VFITLPERFVYAFQNVVDDKLAKMEAAAEADMEDHERRKPATQKLKILAEVEDFLAQVCLSIHIVR